MKKYPEKIATDQHGKLILTRYCKYTSAFAALHGTAQLRRLGWVVSNKYPTADHRVEATQRITKKRAGLLSTKARNVELRKRPKLFTKDIIPLFQAGMTVAEVSRKLGKSRPAIYACFQREEVDIQLYLNS